MATPEAIKKLERAQSEIRVEREVQTDLFKKNLKAVDGMQVSITAKTNGKGSLFKAIHEKDIADALKREHQVFIAEEYIHLSAPIKQTGKFIATIEAMGMKEDVTVNVNSIK